MTASRTDLPVHASNGTAFGARVRWFRGGKPERLIAVVHRRAELLIQSTPPFTVCVRSQFEVLGAKGGHA